MSFAVAGGPKGQKEGASLPPRSPPEPTTGVLAIGSPARVDVPALCERLRLLVEHRHVEVVVLDVRALTADLVAMEALARLALTARRLGRRVALHRPSCELEALLAWCGLADALPGPGAG